MADEDELVFPVPESSRRFKKFGAVQFSDPAYIQSPLLPTLPLTSSLLALSNAYGLLFLVSSSSPPCLFVASTASVVRSIEDDKREQASEASEGVKKVEDAAALDSVWTRVNVDATDVWHVALSADDHRLALVGKREGLPVPHQPVREHQGGR